MMTVTVMLHDHDASSSENESSSEEDDLDFLFVSTLFPDSKARVSHFNINDLNDDQCGMMFRYV